MVGTKTRNKNKLYFYHEKAHKTRSVADGFGRHGMPPPASNDTCTAFCFPNKEEGRTDDMSLWPWPLTLTPVHNVARVVEYPPANFGDTTIRCRFMGCWTWACSSRRGETCLAIDRSAISNFCCLDIRNWQIIVSGDKILDLESDCRKLGSVTIAVPHYRNTACEFGANWYGNGRETRQTTTTSGMR